MLSEFPGPLPDTGVNFENLCGAIIIFILALIVVFWYSAELFMHFPKYTMLLRRWLSSCEDIVRSDLDKQRELRKEFWRNRRWKKR